MTSNDERPSWWSALERDVIALVALVVLVICWMIYLVLRGPIAMVIALVATSGALGLIAWRLYVFANPPSEAQTVVSEKEPPPAAEPEQSPAEARDNERDWLVQLVAYYRGLDFFAQDREFSDEGLAQRALGALLDHLARSESRVSVETWNGQPILAGAGQPLLEGLGFYRDYPAMTWERRPG